MEMTSKNPDARPSTQEIFNKKEYIAWKNDILNF